jgi:CubicO group peptidase (beta-lactamase class C family)
MNTSTPEEVGFSASRLSRIGTAMQRYVDQSKFAGLITLVARRGKVVHLERFGMMDLEAATPMQFDTIFRIYSMTKPITSVALMMLFEHGLVRLTDPVSKFIPGFRKVRVLVNEGELVDPAREITVHDLLRHTAGLSYGVYEDTHAPVDKLYDQADLFNAGMSLQEMVRRIVDLPLAHQPGQAWRYSVATDVVGYLIEVIADTSLTEFFEERILKPLGMEDTAFSVPADKLDRFATVYGLTEQGPLEVIDTATAGDYSEALRLYCGGSGLVSTTADYLRFAQLVLNKGELDGVRLLGPRTVELMTTNHLPPALLPIRMGAEQMPGFGFGLGFSVMMDVAQSGMMGSVGLHGWGGWASTHFWVDPREQLIGILMLQYIPSGTYPITSEFRTLVYQALVD